MILFNCVNISNHRIHPTVHIHFSALLALPKPFLTKNAPHSIHHLPHSTARSEAFRWWGRNTGCRTYWRGKRWIILFKDGLRILDLVLRLYRVRRPFSWEKEICKSNVRMRNTDKSIWKPPFPRETRGFPSNFPGNLTLTAGSTASSDAGKRHHHEITLSVSFIPTANSFPFQPPPPLQQCRGRSWLSSPRRLHSSPLLVPTTMVCPTLA